MPVGYSKVWHQFCEVKMGLVKFSLSVQGVSLLILPIVYIIMAKRQGPTRALARTIIPHIVTILWFDLAVSMWLIGYKHFNIPGVLLTGAVLSLLIFPSYAGVTLSVGVILSQLRSSIDVLLVLKFGITIAVMLLPFFFRKFYREFSKKFDCKAVLNHLNLIDLLVFSHDGKHWALIAVYICSLVMVVSFMFQGNTSFDGSKELTNMTWSQFEKNCDLMGSSSNLIKTQEQCSQLKGTSVNWKGQIQSIRITNIDNSFETLLDYLPDSIEQYLRCFYDIDSSDRESMPRGILPNECSLTRHNLYNFEVSVNGM